MQFKCGVSGFPLRCAFVEETQIIREERDTLKAENAIQKKLIDELVDTKTYVRDALVKYNCSTSYGVTPIEDMVDGVLAENARYEKVLTFIHSKGYSYDGSETIQSLESLIDELATLAKQALKGDSDGM